MSARFGQKSSQAALSGVWIALRSKKRREEENGVPVERSSSAHVVHASGGRNAERVIPSRRGSANRQSLNRNDQCEAVGGRAIDASPTTVTALIDA